MPEICPATYKTMVRYSPPEHVTIHCERTDLDADGRHTGRHHGWQDMTAGERSVTIPDPDRPGWMMRGTEAYDAWRRLWTWDHGGASGSSNRGDEPLITCPACGTPGYREHAVPNEAVRYTGSPDAYAVAGDPDPAACFDCRLWAERATAHTAGWQPRSRTDRRLTRTARIRLQDGTVSDRLNTWADGVTGAFGGRAYTVRWDDGTQRGPGSSLWDSGRIPWWLDHLFPANAVLLNEPERNPLL